MTRGHHLHQAQNEPTVRALAEAHAPVFYAAGTHPMSAAEELLVTVDELVHWRSTRNLSVSGRRVWTITTQVTAPTSKSKACVFILRQRKRPDCRSLSTVRAADEDMARILRETCRESLLLRDALLLFG